MSPNLRGARVLVTGAGGQLGGYLRRALEQAEAEVVGAGSQARLGVDRVIDITDRTAVDAALAAIAPDIVLHAAAYTDVDGAERNPEQARAVNETGSANVAVAAQRTNAYLIGVGTDFVFAGDGGAPFAEDAPTRPLSVYGDTKLAGERAILATSPSFAVARTAWLYGGSGKHFPRTVLTVVRGRGGIDVVDDEFGSPTFAGDLAEALVRLAPQRAAGVFHLGNEGRASRFELARMVVDRAGLSRDLVRPVSTAEFLAKYPLPARRPADSTLRNIRAAALGVTLPVWSDAVARYTPILANELGLDTFNAKG
jgi:dTDP-4-dehydrorhamnose reductase